jgi:hypothetical protein
MGEGNIVRRIEMLTLEWRQQSVSRPNSATAGRLQGVARGSFKSGTLRWDK